MEAHMATNHQLESDLGFVRQVVADADRQRRSPAAIPLLWAAIVLVGFPLIDFAPHLVGNYWAIAGPVGFLISAFIGWRSAQSSGQLRKDEGMRYLLHWGGLLIAIGLAVLLIPFGVIRGESVSPIILLLLAMAYFFGGIHLERSMLPIGILLAIGYVVVLFVPRYAYTFLGAMVSLALVISAVTGSRRDHTAG
jgi:hypothetical protein